MLVTNWAAEKLKLRLANATIGTAPAPRGSNCTDAVKLVSKRLVARNTTCTTWLVAFTWVI